MDVNSLASEIAPYVPSMVQQGFATYTANGRLVLCNSFLDIVARAKSDTAEKPIQGSQEKFSIGGYDFTIPKELRQLKDMYEPDFTRKKAKLNMAYTIGDKVYKHFLREVFGADRPIPHSIVKPSNQKMRVSSYSKDGMEAFTIVMMTPAISYPKLYIATVKAYGEPDYTTGTIGNFFVKGKWQSYYEEVDAMDEVDLTINDKSQTTGNMI